jgi:GNAT superfamily N-acetyltransferase
MKVREILASDTYALRSMVLRPGQPIEANHYPKDHEGIHLGGFLDGKLISVVTMHPEDHPSFALPKQWRIRGMATHPEYRAKGYGSQLLKALLERANTFSLLWCNARSPAVEFYLRHGFTKESEEFLLPTIGPHYLLKREK